MLIFAKILSIREMKYWLILYTLQDKDLGYAIISAESADKSLDILLNLGSAVDREYNIVSTVELPLDPLNKYCNPNSILAEGIITAKGEKGDMGPTVQSITSSFTRDIDGEGAKTIFTFTLTNGTTFSVPATIDFTQLVEVINEAFTELEENVTELIEEVNNTITEVKTEVGESLQLDLFNAEYKRYRPYKKAELSNEAAAIVIDGLEPDNTYMAVFDALASRDVVIDDDPSFTPVTKNFTVKKTTEVDEEGEILPPDSTKDCKNYFKFVAHNSRVRLAFSTYDEEYPDEPIDVLRYLLWYMPDAVYQEKEDVFSGSSGVQVGGLGKGKTLDGMTAIEVLEEILFPEYAPKWTDATANLTYSGDTIIAVGTALPMKSAFKPVGNPAKTEGRENDEDTLAQGGAATDEITFPEDFIEGATTDKAGLFTVSLTRQYADGSKYVVTNKGNKTNKTASNYTTLLGVAQENTSNLKASGDGYIIKATSKSDSKTINVVWPIYACTETAGTLKKQTLTTATTVTYDIKGSSTVRHLFKIHGQATKIEEKNAFGLFDDATNVWTSNVDQGYYIYSKNTLSSDILTVRITFQIN